MDAQLDMFVHASMRVPQFTALALLTPALAALVLTLARPTAAQAKEDRDCPEGEYYTLLRPKQLHCDIPHPMSCKDPGISCAEITGRMARIGSCIRARQALMDRCFHGGDPGHRQEVVELNKSFDRCFKLSLEKKCGDQDDGCKE